MQCPKCGVWTFVKETRRQRDGTKLRRYWCANEHKFVTIERLERMISTRGGRNAKS